MKIYELDAKILFFYGVELKMGANIDDLGGRSWLWYETHTYTQE